MVKQVFTIVPGSAGPIWFFVGLSVLLLAMVALFGYLAYSSRNVRYEVSSEGLRIQGDIFGRFVPRSSLIVSEARELDMRVEDGYRLRWRTNGTGLPGYSAGWFKLRNGQKSLVFMTDRGRAVYIPTRDGYSIILTVDRPEAFLQALRATS